MTIALAYVYRYVFPVAILILPMIFARNSMLLWTGVCFLIFALYSVVGYLLRWKHIYCAFQNAYFKKMTPGNIHWGAVRKRDAYGIPAVFGIIGIGMVAIHFFG